MNRKLTYVVTTLAMLPLLIAALVWTADDTYANADKDSAATNSVRIKIGGQPVDGPFREGDVVHRGTATQDEEGKDVCVLPSIEIRMRGDVKTVRVGPEDDSCDLIVKTLTMSEPLPPDPNAAFLTTAGYRWRVQSLAKVVGVNSIDDLTRTKSWFKFRTSTFTNSGSLFGGSNAGSSCWAHSFPPPYFYNVEDCDMNYNTSSSSQMYAEAIGEYSHDIFDSFAHTVESESIAHGNESMPGAMDQRCYVDSPPQYSEFECELSWEYLGYE